ncbi:MAG TPA: hypothetical protein VFW75_15470 [Acetobacteraceae bacterium]|nr:hypothetical protein [Acetobacteraceae bacterium]
MPTPTPEHDAWVQSTFGLNPADYTTGDAAAAANGAAAPGGFFDSVADAASSAVNGVAAVATDAAGTAGAVAGDIGSGAAQMAGDAVQAVGDAGANVVTGFDRAAGDVGTVIDAGDLSAGIGQAAGDLGQGLGNAAGDVGSGLSKAAQDAGRTAAAVGGDVDSGAEQAAADAKTAVSGVFAGAKAAEAAVQAAEDAAEKAAADAVKKAAGGIGGADATEEAGGASMLGTIADNLSSGVAQIADEVVQAVGDAGASVVTGAEQAAAVGGDLFSGAEQLAADAGAAISGVVADIEAAAAAAVEAAKKAAGGGGKPAPKQPEHQILGSAQTERAQKLIDKMSADDRKKLDELLQGAKSNKERLYITKAIAAGHSVADAEAFEKKIAGKDDKWMQDNLSLTGDSQGKGVQQQWSHSCNATTVEAVRGELDPIYALKMHEDNPNMGKVDDSDATKDNPNLAADQKAKLTSTYHGDAAPDHSGVAANRDDGAHGSGRWANDLLNNMSDVTGVKYDTKKVGDGATTDDAMKTIDGNTATGTPVPLVIGNGQGQYTHYVLVTASDPGPPKQYSIHDPWTGTTVIRSEDQLKNGKLDIAGSNQITAFEKPTPVEVK